MTAFEVQLKLWSWFLLLFLPIFSACLPLSMFEDQLLETVFCVPWHIQGRNVSDGEQISFTERERERKKPMTVSSSRCANCTFREWPLLNASSLSWSYYFLFLLFSFSFLLDFFWKWMSIWPSSIFFYSTSSSSIHSDLSLLLIISSFLTIFLWLSLFKKHLFSLPLKIRHVSCFVNYFYLHFLSSDAFSFLQPQPWIRSLSLGSENSLLFQKTQL